MRGKAERIPGTEDMDRLIGVRNLWLIRGTFTRLAPYERRVIELLRNSKDKRARKLAKKRVRTTSPLSAAHLHISIACRISMEAHTRYN